MSDLLPNQDLPPQTRQVFVSSFARADRCQTSAGLIAPRFGERDFEAGLDTMRFLIKATPASSALECPHAADCPMFGLLRAAGTLKTWQIRYCSGDYNVCERHRLAERGQPVPDNLLPNGQALRFGNHG